MSILGWIALILACGFVVSISAFVWAIAIYKKMSQSEGNPAPNKEDWSDYDEIEDCGLRRSEIVVALKQ